MTWFLIVAGGWLVVGAVVAIWFAPILRDHDFPDLGE